MADKVAAGLPNRGKTWHAGTPTSVGRSADLEGTETYFRDDVEQTGGMKPSTLRSGRQTLARLVRNSSGISLEPKRLVKWEDGYHGRRVNGYCDATAEAVAGVVDDRLPAAGVANNDLFWLLRKGPALVKTSLAGNAENVIDEGDNLVALTAATSQATTAGRVNEQSLAGATEPLGKQIMNKIGKAMSAKTTGNTNADVLVDLDILN